MVTNSTVATILNKFLLPTTEEHRICTIQRTTSAYAMYYSELNQELSKK